jgi:polyisoprenoid-binding protein YceI
MSEQTRGALGTRYRMDRDHNRLTLQAFAGGLLSFLAHSPTFVVRDFEGELRWEPGMSEGLGLDVRVWAGSLELIDSVRPADRQEIESRMRQEVLEVAAYPEIRFQATEIETARVADNRYRLRIRGLLLLHGVTNQHALEAELLRYNDGVRLTGESPLRLSDYRIRPVTALGGAIQLKDQLRVSFDVVAWKEGS